MSRFVTVSVAITLLTLGGCAGTKRSSLPRGPVAYTTIKASDAPTVATDYRIAAGDTLSVIVFQEPDLSIKDVPVDAGGSLAVPLIGRVEAVGKTSFELADEIAASLGRNYLVAPKVSVYVTTASPGQVVVEGSVTSPGVFPIRRETTLIEALALAKGPTQVARLSEVIVFRTIDGQRMGAVFDLAAIRRGDAVDPHIEPNDVVVVGYSGIRQVYRDFISAAPLIGVFTRF